MLAEPGDLSRDPGGVMDMAEAGVIGHDAEHIDVGRLIPQIDGKLLAQRAVIIGLTPGTVKRAEQGVGADLIHDVAIFAYPVGEDPASPRDTLLVQFVP